MFLEIFKSFKCLERKNTGHSKYILLKISFNFTQHELSCNLEVKISEQVERNGNASLLRKCAPACVGVLDNWVLWPYRILSYPK